MINTIPRSPLPYQLNKEVDTEARVHTWNVDNFVDAVKYSAKYSDPVAAWGEVCIDDISSFIAL